MKPVIVVSTMAATASITTQNMSGLRCRRGRISSFASRVGRGVVTRPPPFLGLDTTQALMTSDFATLSAGT